MANVRRVQFAWTAGQVGTNFDFRSDLEVYPKAARKLRNVMVRSQGGAMKRRGFAWIATLPGAKKVTPFLFKITQEYPFVWYDKRLKIFRNDIEVWDSDEVELFSAESATYTQGQTIIINSVTVTLSTGTDIDSAVTDIANASITDVSADKVGNQLRIHNEKSGTAITLAEGNGTALVDLGYTAGTTEKTDIPWSASELGEIRFTQSFDTLWVTHENHPTKTIKRGDTDSDWMVEDYAFKFPPTQSFPDTADWELDPSGTTGSITVVASGGTGNLFDSTWESKRLLINKGLVTLTDTIASPTNSVSGTVDANFALDGHAKDPAWEEEAFSSKRGYARSVGLHQNRLWFGGSRDLPQDYWASQTGDFPNFSRGNGDPDEGILDSLATQSVSTIFDMVPRKGLQMFTHTAEFIVEGQPVTPDDIFAQRQTTIGIANDVRPISAGLHSVFLTRDKKELRLFRFDIDDDQFTTENLTLIAEDLLDQPVDMAFLPSYLDTQSDYVIGVNTDGTISCLSLNTDKGVQAWSTWDTNGKFRSVAVVDEFLYAIVERNGTEYLEKLTEDDVYLDQFFFAEGVDPPTTDFSGATALANQTVQVLANGFQHPDVTVAANGDFTLNEAVSEVHIGYGYTAEIETLPIVVVINQELKFGQKTKKVRAFIRLLETKDLNVDGREIILRKFGPNLLDQPLPEINETIKVTLKGISTDPTLKISSSRPLPMTVLGLIVEVAVGV